MPKNTVKDIEELPLVLTIRQVQDVLGCAKDMAYSLPHMPGFPSMRLGKSIRIPRDQFFAWLNAQAEAQEESCRTSPS
jgi:excisionase family DNA binding protein